MGTIATWGKKKFEITNDKIYPLTDFETSFTLKTDANSDTSGTAPVNTRGRELEPITFKTRCLAAAGVLVRNEIGSWRGLVGQSNPLIIGGASFGAGNFQLQKVGVSEVDLDSNGTFIAATLSFTFQEFIESNVAATAKPTTATSTKGATTATAQKSMAAQLEAQKKESLSVKASATEKANKSPYGNTKGVKAY